MKYSNVRFYDNQLPPEYTKHGEHDQVRELLVALAEIIVPDKLYSIELHKERKPDYGAWSNGYQFTVYAEINEAKEQVVKLYRPDDMLLTPKKTFIERLKVCFKYLKTSR